MTKLSSKTVAVKTGCGNMYVTFDKDNENRLKSIIVRRGKSGSCLLATSNALSGMIILALKGGISNQEIAEKLKGISCPSPVDFGENKNLSCYDALALELEKHTNIVIEKGVK